MVGSPCSPRDSQESSPTPQFESFFQIGLLHALSAAEIRILTPGQPRKSSPSLLSSLRGKSFVGSGKLSTAYDTNVLKQPSAPEWNVPTGGILCFAFFDIYTPVWVAEKFVLFFFLRFFFLMWTISKVFIEFVTILIPFYVLVLCSQGVWDLRSLTRGRTHTPGIKR